MNSLDLGKFDIEVAMSAEGLVDAAEPFKNFTS